MIFLIFKFYWASGILSGNPKWNPNYAGSLTPALSGEDPAWQVLSLGALLAPTVRLPGLPSVRVGLLQLPETSFSRSSWGECNHCFLSLTGQFTWRIHLWDAGNQSTVLGEEPLCSWGGSWYAVSQRAGEAELGKAQGFALGSHWQLVRWHQTNLD